MEAGFNGGLESIQVILHVVEFLKNVARSAVLIKLKVLQRAQRTHSLFTLLDIGSLPLEDSIVVRVDVLLLAAAMQFPKALVLGFDVSGLVIQPGGCPTDFCYLGVLALIGDDITALVANQLVLA